MNRILLSVMLFFLFTELSAQNIKKGYKQLEKSDYLKAKEFFEAEYRTNSSSAAATFGLMIIFADSNSPFYNLTEAWSHARVTEKSVNRLNEEEKAIIAEYFTNTEVRRSNWPVNKKIMQAIGAIEAKLIKYIREENNLELANTVIEKFPDFRYYKNVIHIRNQLEFRKVEKQNNLDGYLEFMKKFPDAAQNSKAVKYRDALAFEKARSINTDEAYNDYMKKYPAAYNYGDALKLRNAAAFRLAKQKNTIGSFEYFIVNYPDALEIADAKRIQQQLLYEYARRIQTLEAYDDFISKYPDGSHYIDIFNLKSLDLGMKFFNSSGLKWNNVMWSRSFDNGKFPDYAGGIAVSGSNEYVIAGNTLQSDSVYRDAWIIKLDENGKMIWNKVLGDRYNDSVFAVFVNNSQDILVLGYTWLTPDSASREGWIFKLDATGKKIWNRSLGKWDIHTAAINAENEIFIGGYRVNDSLEHNYNLMVINNSGKKLWERTYISPGEIQKLLIENDNQIIMGGSEWCFKMNSKGYLTWEIPHGFYGRIMTMDYQLNENAIIISSFSDSVSISLAKIDGNGKKIWQKNYINPGYVSLSSLKILNNNTIALIAGTLENQELVVFMDNGNEIIRHTIPEQVIIHEIMTDKKGNLLLQCTENGNINLIKNSGYGL
ncbi:MAG: PQQ-like beta-propeller repeat protein [Bacteroidales bacterium]|nr:PQQ-like beta-propeller repeat protein [Bacteroidales bacterium]